MKGSASFMVAQKLKHLKERIVKWKKEEFGDIESRKFSCLQKIEALKRKDMEGGLEEDEMAELASVEQEYFRTLRIEEIS